MSETNLYGPHTPTLLSEVRAFVRRTGIERPRITWEVNNGNLKRLRFTLTDANCALVFRLEFGGLIDRPLTGLEKYVAFLESYVGSTAAKHIIEFQIPEQMAEAEQWRKERQGRRTRPDSS
ncbi:protein of unknown function [Methylorubrum extorquens DM4]|uniref:Uncharacterized protein n=2 Tax=Methylorubrum extorquens TaxID=408 RepID=C7C7A7_METED|nr:protein of unknown function [Methylorubrum extorquens DM4]